MKGYPSKKKIILTTTCNRRFEIDLHEVADNRAKYYANEHPDPDVEYMEEYQFLCDDTFEVKDWLFNNMNWRDCSTLNEVYVAKESLDRLEIESCKVIEKVRSK